MRLAYADPPYPGCAHLYPEKTEVDHVTLIAQLCEYDGWALSTNENALQDLLALSPVGVREAPTGFRRRSDLPGQTPQGFCEWVIRCLGADLEDSLDDIFPGTGIMEKAWGSFKQQPSLFAVPVKGSKRSEERVRRATSPGDELGLA